MRAELRERLEQQLISTVNHASHPIVRSAQNSHGPSFVSRQHIFVEILHIFLSLYQNPSHQYWWQVSSLILEYFHLILTSLHFQAHIFTRCSVANLIPRPPPIGYSHRQWTRINFARPNSLFRAKIMRVSEYPLAGMISLPNLPCLASKVNSKRRSTMDVR